MNDLTSELPSSPYERARVLQDILIDAVQANGDGLADSTYRALRREFMADTSTRSLLPSFVATCRDLDHFWGYIKTISSSWAPRRTHVRDGLLPLLDHLEFSAKAHEEAVTGSLAVLDEASVNDTWKKALARKDHDPEGAITAARSLLESVCKLILENQAAGGPRVYGDNDDLPKLYRKTGEKLNLAPSQHTEDVFKRVLGGCTNVVEGLGALRNKVGDAHGTGKRPVRPAARHATLAVNLAGSMALFLVETLLARSEQDPSA